MYDEISNGIVGSAYLHHKPVTICGRTITDLFNEADRLSAVRMSDANGAVYCKIEGEWVNMGYTQMQSTLQAPTDGREPDSGDGI